jgi:hypothetical protein
MQVFNQNSKVKIKSVTWEERGKGKQLCAWIGAERCKTEAAKIEGPSRGKSEGIFVIYVASIFDSNKGSLQSWTDSLIVQNYFRKRTLSKIHFLLCASKSDDACIVRQLER